MRVLVLSKSGEGFGVAYKLAMEGHSVDVWTADPKCRLGLDGIVERPREWRPQVVQSDLIVCDSAGFSPYAELFQKLGKPILCCNLVADALASDMEKRLETLKRSGMGMPDYWCYPSSAECSNALDSIWTAMGLRLTSGDECYICKDIELAKWALTTLPKGEVTAQCLSVGIKVTTEGWFNGREFLTPFNHTLTDECCSGTLMITSPEDKLTKATVTKLEPFLKKSGYRGPVSITSTVGEGSVLGVDMKCGLSYDSIEALMQGLREPVANLLFETALGSKKSMEVSVDPLIAVRVCSDQSSGMPIMGMNSMDMAHVYLCNTSLDSAGILRFTGGSGIILKATAFGKTVEQARERAYKVVDNIKAIDIDYCRDVGLHGIADLKQLRAWGWIN